MSKEWRGPAIIELAASVIWPIKKLNRPLGELLASGEVKERDLRWAAKKYYDPKIKWAAAVELQAQNLRRVTLTPAAARQVVWPFKNLNRPSGDLLDEHIINLHDLAYAVANAHAAQLRNATAVLGAEIVYRRLTPPERQTLTMQSNQPAPTTPFTTPTRATARPPAATSLPPVTLRPTQALQIINGSNYLTQQLRRKRRWTIILAMAMLYLWLGALFISMTVVIMQFFQLAQVPPGWNVAAGVLLVGALFILPRSKRLVAESENYKKGLVGEKRVAVALRRGLNHHWTLFRNVILPGRQDDIDAVLVGPNGIYALEIKTFSGDHRNIGDSWQRKYGPIWRKLSRSPGRQARGNAQRLHDYLQQCDAPVWVEPRVVWASRSKLILKKPAVPVWQLTRGKFIGEDLTRGKHLEEATRHQIVALLKANNLSQRQNGDK